MIKMLSALAILFASVACPKIAFADVIYDLDYNTQTGAVGNFNPNYDQADNGASVISYEAGAGSDGSRSLRVDFDTTTNPNSVSYFTNLASSSVSAPTSGNASDYTLSFDVRVEGFDTGQSQVFTQYDLRIGDEVFRGNLNGNVTDRTVMVNLGDLTNAGAGNFETGDFAGTQQFRIDLANFAGGLQVPFASDTNNAYFVDNIRLEQITSIPEPSSLSLLAAGILGLSLRRKRRTSQR